MGTSVIPMDQAASQRLLKACRRGELSYSAYLLYLHLLIVTAPGKDRDRAAYIQGAAGLANETGFPTSTVRKYLTQLKAAGLVRIKYFVRNANTGALLATCLLKKVDRLQENGGRIEATHLLIQPPENFRGKLK